MITQKMNLNRRQALAAMGWAAFSCRTIVDAKSYAAAPKGKPGIALQLYTLREPAKKDLTDTLKKVRAMGWKYVQWSGMPNLPAEQIRDALKAADLIAMSGRIAVEPFEKDFDESVRFWKTTVGVKDVAPGGMMKDCKATLQDWLNGAKRLDAIGAKLRAAGMRLSYHNHSWEFEKFEGDPRAKLDILLESTRPENLNAELDVAWVLNGGVDPAVYMRTKCKGRCPVIHAKDCIPAKGSQKAQLKPLGQGAVNWKEVFQAGREAGVEWYVYEQDSGEGSPFDYTRASYEFLVKNL